MKAQTPIPTETPKSPIPGTSPQARLCRRRQANCPRIRRVLFAYLMRELGDGRARLVREHLQHCAVCRQFAVETQSLCASIRKADPACLAPRRLSDARLRRLDHALRHPLLDWIFRRHGWVSLFCSLAVLTTVLVWLLTRTEPMPPRGFPAWLFRSDPSAVVPPPSPESQP